MTEHDGPTWPPKEFEPDWPDVLIRGVTVLRSEVGPVHKGAQDLAEGLTWVLMAGKAEADPLPALPAIIGRLTVRNDGAFAGIDVVAILVPRELPSDVDGEYTLRILERYGVWISGVLYDFAASALRTSASSSAYQIDIPVGTPIPQLVLETAQPESGPTESAPVTKAAAKRAPAKGASKKPSARKSVR